MALNKNYVAGYIKYYEELKRFSDNPHEIEFSENMSPDDVAGIAAVGAGVASGAVLFTIFSGMSAASITVWLSRLGLGLGMAGGIATIALGVGTFVWGISSKAKKNAEEKEMTAKLKLYFKESELLEKELEQDTRVNVQNLIFSLRQMRKALIESHKPLAE